jgi:hypothetical protein
MTDPAVVERVEDLKRFLMALTQISMLMNYGRVLNAIADATGRFAGKGDRSEIIRLSIGGHEEAKEALRFALDSKTIRKEEIINGVEREVLERAIA